VTDGTDDRPRSKVVRLIEEYELTGLGAELEARWTGDGYERMSLRDLADLFNTRVLETALVRAGANRSLSDVEGTYRDLTDEDVSVGVRTDTRSRLQQAGIDVDTLERDFVTYQAVRSYLREHREAEYRAPTDAEKLAKDLESIQRLLTRTRSVTEERIENLRATDRVDIDEFEVLLDLNVLCQRCGTQYDLEEFFDGRGCDCRRDSAEE
jgi:hypothetical protein